MLSLATTPDSNSSRTTLTRAARNVLEIARRYWPRVQEAYGRYEIHRPAILLALATLILASVFATIRFDSHHDGFVFKTALDVAHGKVLYRDTYCHYGPFSIIPLSLVLRVFGDYLIAIKLLTACAYALIAFLSWQLWSRLLPRWLSSVMGMAWLLLAPFLMATFLAWASVYCLLFQVLAAQLLVMCLERRQLSYAFAAGISVSFASFSRHTVGVAEFVAVVGLLTLLALMERRQRELYENCRKRFTLGFLLASAATLGWLAVNGALHAWWIQTVMGPLTWARTVQGSTAFLPLFIAKLLPTDLPIDGLLWSAAPVAALVVVVRELLVAYATRGEEPANRVTLLIAVIGLSGWNQYYPVTEYRHCFWAATPMLAFIPHLVWSSLRAELRVFRVTATLTACGLLFYPSVEARVKAGYKRLGETYVTTKTPAVLAGIRLLPEEAKAFEKLSRTIDSYLATNPQKNLVVLDDYPLLLTLSPNVRNVHPAYIPVGITGYPDLPSLYEDYIAREQPLLITSDLSRPEYRSLAFFPKESILGPEMGSRALLGLYLAAPVAVKPTDLTFDILDVRASTTDEIGRMEAKPDGDKDLLIDAKITRGAGEIRSVRIDVFGVDGAGKGRWDSAADTIWWMIGVYRNGKRVVSQKVPSVSLPVAAGQELQFRTNGYAAALLPGSRFLVTWFLADGNVVKATKVAGE